MIPGISTSYSDQEVDQLSMRDLSNRLTVIKGASIGQVALAFVAGFAAMKLLKKVWK